MSEILKLQSWKTYKINYITPIETNFGKTYILRDTNFNQYWANKKITDYINNHPNLLDSDSDKKYFTIKTGKQKCFKNKDGDEVKFLEVQII